MSSNRFKLFKIEPGKTLGRKIFAAGTGLKRDQIIKRVLKGKHGEEKLRDAMAYLEKQAANIPTNIQQSISSIKQALPHEEPQFVSRDPIIEL